MIKLKFKNGIEGSLVDWTDQATIHSVGGLKRRLESRNPGEAGVVVFDKLGVTVGFEAGSNVVYDAFGGDLSAAQKYIFELHGVKEDKSTVKLFEGLTDFSTIDWPDLEKKISFSVLDKLSALELISPGLARTKTLLNTRILAQLPATTFVDFMSNDPADQDCWVAAGHPDIYESFTSPVLSPGEVLEDGDGGYLVVTKSVLASHPIWPALTFNRITLNRIAPDTFFKRYETEPGSESGNADLDDLYYYSKEIFSVDCNNIVSGEATGLKFIEVVRALVQQQWPGVTITNNTGEANPLISIQYAPSIVDESPFGMHSLDALKMLAGSKMSYIYFNRSGDLVLQRKTDISSGTVRTYTPTRKKSGGRKKLFWDKLVDAVSVTVKSGLMEDGIELVGFAELQKQPGIKPRNQLSIEIIAPETVEFTQEALDAYALVVATELFDFYGKRHYYFNLTSDLLDEMFEWDLLDLITINSEQYFILSMDMNASHMPRSASFELVSVNGYDYDYRQAQSPLSPGKYNSNASASSSISSSSGSSGYERNVVYV